MWYFEITPLEVFIWTLHINLQLVMPLKPSSPRPFSSSENLSSHLCLVITLLFFEPGKDGEVKNFGARGRLLVSSFFFEHRNNKPRKS
jgi:hypothetical protein